MITITQTLSRLRLSLLRFLSRFRVVNFCASKAGLLRPRVVSLVDGGLGSQMWQFALGYSIAKERGLPLYLDTSFFKANGKDLRGIENRKLLLFDTFPVIRDNFYNRIETSERFMNVYSDRSKRTTYEFNPQLLVDKNPIFLSQYYMNVNYILKYKEDLHRYFAFCVNTSDYENYLIHQIRNTESCSVHIRKGDYVGLNLEVCTDTYYISAMKKIAELVPNVTFYIFSNDENYFPSRIQSHCANLNVVIVKDRSEELPSADLFLMQQCKHSIISNSGFSWIAAFLKNCDGVVIMPDHWNNDEKRKESSRNAFYVPGWIKLPV